MQLLVRMTALLLGVMSLAACASIMIVSNSDTFSITGYEVGDGTQLNGNVPPNLTIGDARRRSSAGAHRTRLDHGVHRQAAC
jgi:hypothetical protein